MDSPQIEKVVAFGGKIYNCLNEYDNGNKDAFNVIIDQLSDPLLDYKVLLKLLKEVRQNKRVHSDRDPRTDRWELVWL